MDALLQALDSFRCYQDADVESFLRKKAIEYDSKDICRVYLILDENEFNNGRIIIVAYFTLSLRALVFSDGTSKTNIKRITGFKDRKASEFVLIGQIGKYKHLTKEKAVISTALSIDDILDYVVEVIDTVKQYIPCGALLVECTEDVHSKGIYSQCRTPFKLLQKDGEYYQYYRPL